MSEPITLLKRITSGVLIRLGYIEILQSEV